MLDNTSALDSADPEVLRDEEAILPDLPVDEVECDRNDLNENLLEETLESAWRAALLGQVLVSECLAVVCAERYMD